MKKLEISAGPILYYCWFGIGNRRYVIDIGQNILFWIFPFLMYIVPLKCYMIHSNENWKNKKKNKKNLSGTWGVICGLIGSSSFFTYLINHMDIGINIPPVISIITAVIIGFAIAIVVEHKEKKYKNGEIVRLRVYQDDYTDYIKQLLRHFFILLMTCVAIGILHDNPGNIYWFLGVVFLIWLLSLAGSSCLIEKVKIKFINNSKE